MERMWMVRSDGGNLDEASRERGVAAIGGSALAVHAKPGVDRQRLAALYRRAEPQARRGSIVSGASIPLALWTLTTWCGR